MLSRLQRQLSQMMTVGGSIWVRTMIRVPARGQRMRTYMSNSDSDVVYSIIADSCIDPKKSSEA